MNNDQQWTNALITSVTTAINAYIAATAGVSSGGTTIASRVNISYFNNFHTVLNPVTGRYRNVPTLRAVPVVDAITGSLFRQTVASQRRRNRAPS